MPTEYDPSGAPVFGAGTADSLTATRQFAIESYHTPSGEMVREMFTSYADPGSGPILEFMRARNTQGQAQASSRLIFDALVDDDGLSVDYDEDDLGEDEERDARLDEPSQWSSRRRFVHLVESADHRIGSEVLDDLADWITREAHKRGGKETRPTAQPAPSSRGRTATRSGSPAKRRTKP